MIHQIRNISSINSHYVLNISVCFLFNALFWLLRLGVSSVAVCSIRRKTYWNRLSPYLGRKSYRDRGMAGIFLPTELACERRSSRSAAQDLSKLEGGRDVQVMALSRPSSLLIACPKTVAGALRSENLPKPPDRHSPKAASSRAALGYLSPPFFGRPVLICSIRAIACFNCGTLSLPNACKPARSSSLFFTCIPAFRHACLSSPIFA